MSICIGWVVSAQVKRIAALETELEDSAREFAALQTRAAANSNDRESARALEVFLFGVCLLKDLPGGWKGVR